MVCGGGLSWCRACVVCVTIDILENLLIWKLLSPYGTNRASIEEVLSGCKSISIETFGNFFKGNHCILRENGTRKQVMLEIESYQ